MKKGMKKKCKTGGKVPQAAQGYQMNPWEQVNPNQYRAPIYDTGSMQGPEYYDWNMGNQSLSSQYSPAPQGQEMVQPMQYTPQPSTPPQTASKGPKNNSFGGVNMGEIIGGGIGLLNALIPEQQDKRQFKKFQPDAYNPYSMGIANSQAIYDDGGYVPFQSPTTQKTRKQGNIQVTEEIPMDFGVASLPEFVVTGKRNQPAPPQESPYFSFDRLHTPAFPGQYTYAPRAHGNMSQYEYFNQVQQTPDYIDGNQVEKSPSFLREAFNILPDTTSNQWLANYDYTQAEPMMYDDGGEVAKSGIHINPKNKGKFNALKKRTGKSTEELTHSKNPLTRKRAVFAQNASRWAKKEDGGNIQYNEGESYDLSPEQIQSLTEAGYQLDFE